MNFKLKLAIVAIYLLIIVFILFTSYTAYQQFIQHNIITGWIVTIISTLALLFICYLFRLATKVNKS